MHAKHLYLSILTIASISATACSSDSGSTDSPADGMEMRFTASTDTRAALVNSTTIKSTPFAVYGEYTLTGNSSANPAILFNATPVTFTNGAWSYGTPQYWFPGYTYSFIALHPGVETNGITSKDYSDNTLSFTYTLPSDYTKATDILTAVHQRKYTMGQGHPVSFKFTHILSRINFTAHISSKGADQGNITSKVLIKRLVLRNISNSASFSITPSPITGETESDYFVSGWTNHSESTSTLFDITPNDGAGVTVKAGESYEFFPNRNIVVSIPQLLTQNLEVEITYQPYNGNNAQDEVTVKSNFYSTTVAAHGGSWQPGQSYSYSFTLGGEEYIVFSNPSVKPWEETEGGNYIISD